MSELTKSQEDMSIWWVRFRLAQSENECIEALNGAIKCCEQQFVERACAVVDDIAPRYYGLKFSKCYRHRIDTLEDTKQALRDEFK